MKLNNSFVAGQMISKSEMLAAGLPIGNPHTMQAPFNRRYEMPFAPLVGAFTAIGAASGIVGTTLAVVNFAAVAAMYAGVAMTVTGLVTGDKELMKLGGLVGLAGGVGSLAIGGIASVVGGGELALGNAGIESMNSAMAAEQSAQNVANSAALNSFTGATANEAMQSAAQMTPVVNTTANASTAVNGLLQSGAQGIAPQSSALISQQAGGNLLNSAQALQSGGQGAVNAASTASAKFATMGSQTFANQSQGFFSDLMSQMTAKDWAMLGGSAVIGGAKSMAAHAQTAAQQEAADNLRAQRSKNLNTIPQLTTLGTLGTQPAGA